MPPFSAQSIQKTTLSGHTHSSSLELQPGEQLTFSLTQAADKTNATGSLSAAQPAFPGPAHMVKIPDLDR